MGQLGDLFPGAKIRKDLPEDAGNGQRFEPGPLDLDGGVIRLRAGQPTPPPTENDSTENDGASGDED